MANGNYVRFTDSVEFSLVDPNLVQIKDDFSSSSIKNLEVRIAATHSGVITRNNGFYLPNKMRAGTSSFTDSYQKPVLLHHDKKSDPIGRIAKSIYVDTSVAIADKFNGLEVKNSEGGVIGSISDTMIRDFSSGDMPYGMQVDVIRDLFKDSILQDKSYQGLGHIQLVANISDSSAIEKFLDGRYSTGSVGATTDRAVCSVCKTDWTESGRCEHKPGDVYDGLKCFMIAGELDYEEYSIVNMPADRHSKVIELNFNGVRDEVEYVTDDSNRIYVVRLGFPQYDSTTEETMPIDNGKEKVQDKVAPETPVEEVTPTEVVVEDQAKEDTTEEVKDETDVEFLTRVLASKSISDEDRQRGDELLYTEMETFVSAGLITDSLEDSKLTKEARARLPKSSFCGPDRLFPVHDANHVLSANRLLGKIEDAEAKLKATTIVNRKAKIFEVDLSKEISDNINHSRILRLILGVLDEDNYYSDNPVLDEGEVETLRSVMSRMVQFVGQDSFKKALFAEDLVQSETSLMDEVAKNEDLVIELRDRVSALSKEHALLHTDLQDSQDSLTTTLEEKRKVTENHLSILVALKDQKVEDSDFSTMSTNDLESEVIKTLQVVDMTAITGRLGDGITRNPSEVVEDDVTVTETDEKPKITLESVKAINDKYFELRLGKNGSKIAEQFLSDCRREGLLPPSKEFNEISKEGIS